jgi:hypothetical protein
MKTITSLAVILVAIGLLCASALPAAAQAQGGGGMRGVLNQDQRTKMRESLQSSQTQLTQLNDKLAAAQKEAITAMLAKDATEKSIQPKIEAVSKIQTEMALLRFKAVKEIVPTLTEEQKTQLQERPAVGYTTLVGGFGGMGGGRRGGAGGGGANQ